LAENCRARRMARKIRGWTHNNMSIASPSKSTIKGNAEINVEKVCDLWLKKRRKSIDA
jgi:hypothetical protein